MNQEQLKAVYFGYFDQLPEPWRSQAKENYGNTVEKALSIPDSIIEAVNDGLWWRRTKQGQVYWQNIYDALGQGWNYLPLLPTDTSKVYEVACYLEDDETEWIMRCAWNGNSETMESHLGAGLYFLPEGENYSLFDRDLIPYAWRPVPPVSIPPRPVNP